LHAEGFEARATDDGREALRWLAKGDVGVVLVDLQMPKMSGFEFLKKALSLPPVQRPTRIVMTGRLVGLEAEDYATLEISGTIVKPFELDELRRRVEEALTSPS
jgi:DNA-binding response OmpR family regulator